MTRLEAIDGGNWESLLNHPKAVLMLGKSDCEHCKEWSAELETLLADEAAWSDVRFGKMLLDTPGLGSFKKANPWLSEVDSLPTTLLYRDGEQVKSFVGGGVARLENRLRRLDEEAG